MELKRDDFEPSFGEDVYIAENAEINPELKKQILLLEITKLADKMRTEEGEEPPIEDLIAM